MVNEIEAVKRYWGIAKNALYLRTLFEETFLLTCLRAVAIRVSLKL